MEPITLLILLFCVTLGGLLVGVGVHFVPVGGAPAAMAQATGIGTGTTMLAFASGALGLISAGFTVHDMLLPPVHCTRRIPDLGQLSQIRRSSPLRGSATT